MIKTLNSVAVAAGLALTFALPGLAVAGAGSDPGSAETPVVHKRKTVLAGSEMVRAVAEVIAIDMPSRTVTLKRDDGNTLTVIADARVKNLAQLKVGDFVVAEFGRALAISLKKGSGVRSSTETETSITAKPGSKPAASGQRKLHIVADIIAIDDKKGLATVQGPKGNVVDVMVKNPKSLATVQVGDQVELTYTEAVAISVRPAKTKK